jgi:hypothetical protein
MAHYAQVNSDKVVVQVLVMDNEMETNEGEQACIDWLQTNVHADDWVQTSYNNKIRKQFAGTGFTYDKSKDIFIAPQPFASWSLDSSNDWQPPIAMPDDASDDKMYVWDEDAYQANNSKGWVVAD